MANQLEVILVRLNQQERTLPNDKHQNFHFCNLPYIHYYSSCPGRKISLIINKYCKDLNVKISFSPFKLSAMLPSGWRLGWHRKSHKTMPTTKPSPVIQKLLNAESGLFTMLFCRGQLGKVTKWIILALKGKSAYSIWAIYQIDVSFSCVSPVINHEFRHFFFADPRGDSRVDPQTTLTMLWRNSWSITAGGREGV